ncbi:MAG: Hsp20/alpha crystallin family protein [Gemmatimonadota bacterium]|nr:Hsp20/alpha crystallin family protein [Gemmatimonadota bacterium]
MTRLPITYRTPLRVWPELGSEFERFFDAFPRRTAEWSQTAATADFFETDDGYTLELEAPGFEAEEIDVNYEGGVLSVVGSHSAEHEDDDKTYHVRERSFERFTRSFSLPETIKADDIDAHVEDGVLTVVLPKAADAKPKRISVKSKK